MKHYFLVFFLIAPFIPAQTDWSNEFVCKQDSDIVRINNIISSMTLREKVGQIIMPDIQHVTPEEAKKYNLGSILNGGGSWPNNSKNSSVADWQKLSAGFYNASPVINNQIIPIIWGTDAVHGHSNVIGATVFPHNIGLGATQDTDLIYRIARSVAKEVLSTGIIWTFAPTVTVPQNDTWGRTYEGFSENPKLVSDIGEAFIKGFQGEEENFLDENHIMATAKHFIGDGGTFKGIDKGDTRINESGLKNIHGVPYYAAINACVQSIMASFNSWNGKKLHGYEYLLTDVLRNEMQFEGLVVGDWNGHGEVPGCTNANCPQSFNAGVDIYMAPDEWKELYTNTVRAVKSGDILMERLDEAVQRILHVKLRLGLLDGRKPHNYKNYVGSNAHKEIAREAVSKSLVLLKNNNSLLPLDPSQHFLIIGDAAINIMNQMGGWTITWQGTELDNTDFPGVKNIYEALAEVIIESGGSVEFSQRGNYEKKPDVVIAVFGENPYAEFFGDVDDVSFNSSDFNYLKGMQKLKNEGVPIASIFLTGRPLVINEELNLSESLLTAWLPGQMVEGISDVIFLKKGEIYKNFTGKLPFSWPKKNNQTVLNSSDPLSDHLFPFGYGLTYSDLTFMDLVEEQKIQKSIDNLIIFEGSTLQNSNEFIIENNNLPSIVNGNIFESDMKNISLRRINFKQQYDTRNIIFKKGERLNAWGIYLPTVFDFSNFSSPYLSINMRINKISKNPLFVVATCGNNCNGAFQINDLVNNSISSEWLEVDISFKCLEKRGLDLTKVDSPFMLMTNGSWNIDVNKITINNQRKSKRVIKC